ncbi:MAG: flippase [Candidatus Omnitrophota bacterium]
MIEIDDASKITRNTLFLNISTIASSILAFILSVTLAKYLGKVEFGQYTFAIYFTCLFLVLPDLGLSNLVVREVARDKKITSKYLSSAVIIKAALSVFTFILIFMMVNIINYAQIVKIAVYILALYIILKSFGSYFISIFMAYEKMGFVALLNFLLTLSILIGVVVAIILKGGLKEVLLSYLVGALIYIILSFGLIIKKFARPKFEIDLVFWKNLMKDSLPFAFFGLFSNLALNIDVTLLKTIKGDIPTAYYGVALALTSVFLFIPVNLTTALFPVFSRLYQSSRESLAKYYEKSFQFLLILALPLGMGMSLLADRIILLVYGHKYLASSGSVQILAWSFALMFLISLVSILLPTTNRQKTATIVIFWGLILNIILNLILIPRFSYLGASLARLITIILLFIVYFYIISKNIHRLNLIKIGIRPVLATLLMAGFIQLFKNINLFLLIILAIFVYFFILILLKTLTFRDIRLLGKIFKK